MDNLKNDLLALGVDYDTALERFLGKSDFYEEFLFMFLEDEQMQTLEESLQKKDITMAFKAAHTLKGLCGNLGFKNLLQYIFPMVEILRSGSLSETDSLMADLSEAYNMLCSTLSKYQEQMQTA